MLKSFTGKAGLAVLPALLALIACGGEEKVAEGTFDDGEGNKGTYEVSRKDGEEEVRIQTDEGKVTFTSGQSITPGTLPHGFKIIPGAKVLSTVTGEAADGGGAMVMFNSPLKQDAVIKYYRKMAEEQGFEIETQATINDMQMLAGSNENEASFSIQATPGPDGSGTRGTLILSKDKARPSARDKSQSAAGGAESSDEAAR